MLAQFEEEDTLQRLTFDLKVSEETVSSEAVIEGREV